MLTLATSVAIPATVQTDQPAKLSKGLLQAGIEEMTVIGEWRTAVVNAVQNNNPITEDGLDGYRRNADSKLAVASTTVWSQTVIEMSSYCSRTSSTTCKN